jgi:hypothetical protein
MTMNKLIYLNNKKVDAKLLIAIGIRNNQQQGRQV